MFVSKLLLFGRWREHGTEVKQIQTSSNCWVSNAESLLWALPHHSLIITIAIGLHWFTLFLGPGPKSSTKKSFDMDLCSACWKSSICETCCSQRGALKILLLPKLGWVYLIFVGSWSYICWTLISYLLEVDIIFLRSLSHICWKLISYLLVAGHTFRFPLCWCL